MTAYMYDVTSVSPAPPDYRIRTAVIDEAGRIRHGRIRVAAFAVVTSWAVDGTASGREIEAAYFDPKDGSVRPFSELVTHGWRVARVLAPGEADDAHDDLLVAQLLEERDARARLEAVAGP